MRQVMPHRNNIVADTDDCKSFLLHTSKFLSPWGGSRSLGRRRVHPR
jgi:hypothetical protein